MGTLQSKLVTTQQQLVEVNDKKETETIETMKLKEHIKKLQIELESLHKTYIHTYITYIQHTYIHTHTHTHTYIYITTNSIYNLINYLYII